MQINQDQFWGSNVKVCVTHPVDANVAKSIRDFQQKNVCSVKSHEKIWVLIFWFPTEILNSGSHDLALLSSYIL